MSDVQDFHGATFGDEVDEDPNLPEWVEESTSSTTKYNNDIILYPESKDFEEKSTEKISMKKNLQKKKKKPLKKKPLKKKPLKKKP